jgi:hypothetical protein
MSTFDDLLQKWHRADTQAIAYWLTHPACRCRHEQFVYRQLREVSDAWYARARREIERERRSLPLL